MINNGPFVLFLIVAVIAFMLARSFNSWIAKLIFFLVALGATNMTAAAAELDGGWVLLLYVVLFIAIGLSSIRIKNTGNRVLGVVLTIVGFALVFPALNQLGAAAPGSFWTAIVDSFGMGWNVFLDTIQRAVGRT